MVELRVAFYQRVCRRFDSSLPHLAGVAQWLARGAHNSEADGSIPSSGTDLVQDLRMETGVGGCSVH